MVGIVAYPVDGSKTYGKKGEGVLDKISRTPSFKYYYLSLLHLLFARNDTLVPVYNVDTAGRVRRNTSTV